LRVFTTEEQHSLVRFLWAEGTSATYIHEEMFPVHGRKCLLSCKAFHNWVANFPLMTKRLKREWLRQQSKDLYPVGFDALVKQWDKCINVGGGCVEK
jgi:hypothetical protein